MERKQKRKRRVIVSMSQWQSTIQAKLMPSDIDSVKLTIKADNHTITVQIPTGKFVQAIEQLQTNSREFAKIMRSKECIYAWKARRLESVSSKTPE